jgi:hypothetical protein
MATSLWLRKSRTASGPAGIVDMIRVQGPSGTPVGTLQSLTTAGGTKIGIRDSSYGVFDSFYSERVTCSAATGGSVRIILDYRIQEEA